MKTYVLSTLLSIFILSNAMSTVKNGYGTDITGARESIRSLNLLLKQDNTLSVFQRIAMKTKIERLENFIIHYELTERLLEQFKTISPDLYYEIDTLTDATGRSLDVYVKFVPEHEMPRGVAGTTNLAQDTNDESLYVSEYGSSTVSVRIAVVNKALSLLAHEFGHVKYQVPNLAEYCKFYSKYYLENSYKGQSMGHNDIDDSGQLARDYSNRFRKSFSDYQKIKAAKIDSHLVLLQVIKEQLPY